MSEETTGTLVLQRQNSFMNRARAFRVFADGVEIGEIRNKQTENFKLSAGTHQIEVKIDWCGSNTYELDISPNKNCFLSVKSGMPLMPYLYILFMAFLLVPMVAHIPFFKSAEWQIVGKIVPGIFLLYMLFYYTIGRKKYLKVEPDKSNPFAE